MAADFIKLFYCFLSVPFGRHCGDNFLSPESRCVDEPKQCCLGTIQHRMGTCHRSDYGNACPLQRPKRRISLYTWCISRGAYEYLCSVFTEIVFGKVFWDYSNMPFNLGGRINLLYCLFWGIASVVWFKIIYVRISAAIEKIPIKLGKAVTWVLIVFMCVNVTVTCMALVRHDQRAHGIPAQSGWQQSMDEHFDDARMERIYPDAQQTD